MEAITRPQLQKLHCLYRDLSIDNKDEMLLTLTAGRTASTAELTKQEASQLISALSGDPEGERKRKTIYSLAYQAGIIYGDTDLDKKLNRIKLNTFLTERGAVKKALEQMSHAELNKTHRQLAAIVKHNSQTKDNKLAKAATDSLLKELNITVQ